jgi:hypothetical protein
MLVFFLIVDSALGHTKSPLFLPQNNNWKMTLMTTILKYEEISNDLYFATWEPQGTALGSQTSEAQSGESDRDARGGCLKVGSSKTVSLLPSYIMVLIVGYVLAVSTDRGMNGHGDGRAIRSIMT